MREGAPLAFQLLGDGSPSEWIHSDPKERGVQLQNMSAIELRRLLDSYYQPPGRSPVDLVPPPWGLVPSPLLQDSSTPPVESLALCVEGANAHALQSAGALS